MAVPIAGAPLGALPVPATALVGRDVELAELSALLAAPGTRLVTLTGPPGVGKTRLAVAAAAAVADRFADGVVFVDLTAVRDPALVPSAVAAALGSRTAAADGLARALTDRELLLVLDNGERGCRRSPCSSPGSARTSPATRSRTPTGRRWPRSARASTGCRWPSSSRPRGRGS